MEVMEEFTTEFLSLLQTIEINKSLDQCILAMIAIFFMVVHVLCIYTEMQVAKPKVNFLFQIFVHTNVLFFALTLLVVDAVMVIMYHLDTMKHSIQTF